MPATDDRTTTVTPSDRIERLDTIVIGAGQAGLAAAYHLAQHDVETVVLTADHRVGDSWRARWDSLRLFTPARYSGLPGMPFPASDMHLADKEEVADYFERYVERFDLDVRVDTRVSSLTFDGRRYVLTTGPHGRRFEADNIVVATGATTTPVIPAMHAEFPASIQQLHSSSYRNPFALAEGPVLVVGAGNSGAQIALELAGYRKVWLAGRETGHLPRRFLGRDLFDWIWPVLSRATRDTAFGRRVMRSTSGKGFPLIGIPERSIRESGITRLPRLSGVRGGAPVCGETVVRPSVIIWCTGFRSDYSWIELPVFGSDGLPRHRRGEVEEAPGLFFAGLPFQHSKSSTLLGGVGADTAYIARRIAARSIG